LDSGINDKDRLAYNHSDSHPDVLGLKVLRELREVEDLNVVGPVGWLCCMVMLRGLLCCKVYFY